MIVTESPKKNRREYYRRYYASDLERSRKNNRERMAAWRAANPEKAAAKIRCYNKRRYGITAQQWDAMFAMQGRKCANPACGSTEPKSKKGWSTDHCHTSGKLRAILCQSCNIALGFVKDSPKVLRGLADYLEQHAGARQ